MKSGVHPLTKCHNAENECSNKEESACKDEDNLWHTGIKKRA